LSKKVLVTGAAGFIGSHTVEGLLARGDEVIGLDNLDPYYDVSQKRANLAEIQNSSEARRFSFIEGDIRDQELLRRIFSQEKLDVVIHLAAMAGVRASIDQPQLYVDVNVSGTINLLEVARISGLRHFVFASTSSVYGNSVRLPFHEDMPADRQLSPYAVTKRAGELLGHTYHHLYGQNFTSLRLFTVYGPRNRPDMMAYKVLHSIFTGQDLPLYGGGNMYRDWTYVTDTVSGILAAADRPLGYETFNLGRGESVLLLEFVRTMEELVGRKAKLVAAPKLDSDAAATQADVGKARQLLGYAPKVPILDGIVHCWSWYQRYVLGLGDGAMRMPLFGDSGLRLSH
jgi:UDP-glucuronate 4-epimerase